MLHPQRIAWVGIHAEDLERLDDFYGHVLGLALIEVDKAEGNRFELKDERGAP